MASLNAMVKKVAGLANTRDVNDWENQFINRVVELTKNGTNTSMLTEAQVDKLEQLHDKHFEG
jgi:hypothetical protein